MKKMIIVAGLAAAFAMPLSAAQANGWGHSGHNNYSSGLINVSPSVTTGNLGVLNGTRVLNNSPILSGNVVSGVLSGNRTTSIGNGALGGNVLGILSGNSRNTTILRGGKRR